MECLIYHKHSVKILCKSKHFPGVTKQNMSGSFLLNTAYTRRGLSYHVTGRLY